MILTYRGKTLERNHVDSIEDIHTHSAGVQKPQSFDLSIRKKSKTINQAFVDFDLAFKKPELILICLIMK